MPVQNVEIQFPHSIPRLNRRNVRSLALDPLPLQIVVSPLSPSLYVVQGPGSPKVVHCDHSIAALKYIQYSVFVPVNHEQRDTVTPRMVTLALICRLLDVRKMRCTSTMLHRCYELDHDQTCPEISHCLGMHTARHCDKRVT